jgi:hypothetical protein
MNIVKRHGEIVVLYGDTTTYLYDDALSHEPLLYLAHDEQPIAQSVCGAYEVIACGGRPLATGDADEPLGWIARPAESVAGLDGDEAAQQLASDKDILGDSLPGGLVWADDAASALVDAYLDRLFDLDHHRYHTAQIAVTMSRLGIASLPDLAAAGVTCKGRVSYPTLNRIMTGQHRREPGTALKLRAMCHELEALGVVGLAVGAGVTTGMAIGVR